jgi:hypothetical protein
MTREKFGLPWPCDAATSPCPLLTKEGIEKRNEGSPIRFPDESFLIRIHGQYKQKHAVPERENVKKLECNSPGLLSGNDLLWNGIRWDEGPGFVIRPFQGIVISGHSQT